MLLGKLLGSGSFGKVYEIGDNKVVKFIHLSSDGMPNYIEPYILLGIKHSSIMRAISINVNDRGLLKIVMNKASVITNLDDRLIRKDRVLIHDNIRDGITFLHNKGIIHGDIKPSNILYEGKKYMISDFGLSILLKNDPQKIHYTIYTEKYRPPEIGNRLVSTKSDVWAFGKMMREFLTELECEKRGIREMTRYKMSERPSLCSKISFPTDEQIIKNNKYIIFKNERWERIFCRKLRNTGKDYNCSEEYLKFERWLCNKEMPNISIGR